MSFIFKEKLNIAEGSQTQEYEKKYGADINCIIGDVDANGVLQAPTGGEYDLDFSGIKRIGTATILPLGIASRQFAYKFYASQNIKSVVFPDLETIRLESMEGTFNGSSITSLSCPKLKYIAGYSPDNNQYRGFCQWCSQLESISFDELESITNDNRQFIKAFSYCQNLKNVLFPKLKTITAYGVFERAFESCTQGLENVSFPSLETIQATRIFAYAFAYCTSLQSVSFPALTSQSFSGATNQFYNMLQGVTGCTVHFPSNLQSVIGSWSDVTSGFGGTNTTVLFDLTATE